MGDENNSVTQEERDRKLTQYGQVLSYLQYENTVHGERSNFFLIATTALLAFAAGGFLPLKKSDSWEKLGIYFVVSVAGLLLTVLWCLSTKAGNFWLDHWHKILREDLEPAAYGDLKIHRMPPPDAGGPRRTRIRTINKWTLRLFLWIWSLSVLYALVHLLTKYIATICSQGCP